MQWLVFFTLVLTAVALRDRRQVTYQADENPEIDEPTDDLSVRPVTRKPLPLQVVYPGDLSIFFTTEAVEESQNFISNITSSDLHNDQNKTKRHTRSLPHVNRREGNKEHSQKTPYRNSPNLKNKHLVAQESRLHSSYHKPSVSIMNDIPVEMSFDGAGFLRYEDDSDEDKSTHYSKSRNSRPKQEKTNQDNTQAMNDFRAAFNVSTVRMPNQIKYDDEVPYQNQNDVPTDKNYEEKLPDHGAQAQNGVPFAVDFMTAFQHGMFANPPVKYSPQPTQIPQQPAYDPFQFYQNMFSNQANTNTMLPTTSQQDPFLQNHRVPVLTNTDAVSQNTMYSQIPQQFMSNPTNPVYVPNVNMQQYQKKQRRKRSVSLVDNGNIVTSQASEDHYRYSGEDRQVADSGFLPITGTYNGGAIQLNFPYYGQSQMHSPAVSAYSLPVNQDSRYYGNPVERFYYPSEARRYSYGVLGSGNFEVIRGGVFPNERPRQNYHGGYQDSRAPYISNSFPNYGTTEIIIDGPIQGFQGFDNFNVQLINALSKHSELAVKPDHRDRHDLST